MRNSRCAFALIEVLIGSGLLGVMSVSLYLGIAQGFAFVQIARENLRATQILQEKLETVRLYTWDQVIQPGFIPSAFTNYYYPSGGSGSQGAVYRGTTTVSSAPVGGNLSRFVRLARPNLLAPCIR